MTVHKAVGIVSGGLDSLLAVKLVQKMGIEVTALHFVIGFEPGHLRSWMERPDEPPDPPQALVDTGARVEVCDIRAEYMPLLAAPRHGYGSQINPCIDCHAFMLKKAAQRMEELGAAFVFSGEVLGQRPMSQRKQALGIVARECGLGDRLVRPLCGALLEPTAPEREGVFKRSDLLDIHGRTRHRQTALAEELGLLDYPSPAGGCLLTDPQFCNRLGDQLDRRQNRILDVDDPLLLFVGRHIVLPDGSKAIVGRHELENTVIERFSGRGVLLAAQDHPGPSTLVEGQPSSGDILAAAQLTARYGKGRELEQVVVNITGPDEESSSISVKPESGPDCRIIA